MKVKSLIIILLSILLILGCTKYEKIDFQVERCKQPPTNQVIATKGANLRWEFSLSNSSNDINTEPVSVAWVIDERTFVAQQVSYQFDKRGSFKIRAVLTNRCFMQTERETSIIVD